MICILNTLPQFFLMFIIYNISNRIWVSYLAGGFPFIFIHIVNHYKMILREEPITPADLFLGGEATNVINLSELEISMFILSLIILFTITVILFALFIRPSKHRIITRLIGIIAPIIIFIIAYNSIYKDVEYYNSFSIAGNIYSTVNNINQRFCIFFSYKIKYF